MRVLLAGASGQVGRRVLALLREAGHDVRAISGLDLTRPGAAHGLAEGCEVVMSCAGASVSLAAKERRSYLQVDPVLHRHLINEALRAGAYRFVYLGVHVEEAYLQTAYVRAHEQVVVMLRETSLESTVLRPTGIFSAFEDLLPLARKGVLPRIGNGLARTNPIDPQDVAELMVAHLSAGPADLPCGGPHILTRTAINQIIGGTTPWMPKIPAALLRAEARALGLFHRRMADLIDFFSLVATVDAIAPARGHRTLQDYFHKASC